MRTLAVVLVILFSIVCLALSEAVQKPVEPISQPKPVSVCSATGDPHYHTFDGKDFNMYGIGDYLLVERKPDVGFSGFVVQTKTKKWGAGSANVAVAIKVNGNIIIIEAADKKITANTQVVTLVDSVNLLHGAVIKKVSDTVYRVIARDGSAVEVRIGHEKFAYMDIHVYLRESFKGKVSGMCGNFDGKIDNDLSDETGTAFVVQWADDLFTTKETGYTNTEKPAAWKNADERIRAIRLCRSIGAKGINLINCVRDFKLTRDVESIASYRHVAEDVSSLKEWVFEQRAVRAAKNLKGECKSRLAKVLFIARKQREVIEKLRHALEKTVKIARSALQKKQKVDFKPVDFNAIYAKKKLADAKK